MKIKLRNGCPKAPRGVGCFFLRVGEQYLVYRGRWSDARKAARELAHRTKVDEIVLEWMR